MLVNNVMRQLNCFKEETPVRSRHSWEDNIEMELGYEEETCIRIGPNVGLL
jgi:hypothetical protein